MFEIRFSANIPVITQAALDAIKKDVHRQTLNAFKAAVKAYFRQLMAILPYRTGFLRGSYRRMAALFGETPRDFGGRFKKKILQTQYRQKKTLSELKQIQSRSSGSKKGRVTRRINSLKNEKEAQQKRTDAFKKKVRKYPKTVAKNEQRQAAKEARLARMNPGRPQNYKRRKGGFVSRFSKVEIYTHFGNARVPKTPYTGSQYTTPPDQILTVDGQNAFANPTPTVGQYVFFFRNVIRYLGINKRKKNWPIELAYQAFRETLARELNSRKLPNIAQYLPMRRVRTRG